MTTYLEIRNNKLDKIKKVYNYPYDDMIEIKQISQNLIEQFLDLEPWEEWITNPANETDYTYNIYIPLENCYLEYPEEIVSIINEFCLQNWVNDKLTHTLLKEMKRRAELRIQHYNDFWLEIDGYHIYYEVKQLAFGSEPLLKNFLGLKISLNLMKSVNSIQFEKYKPGCLRNILSSLRPK